MKQHGRKEPLVKPAAVNADINVTPLVDVCLVLLIIFMVVTPLLQKGVDVAMPEALQPEKVPENEKQVTIAIKMDGSVFVGQDWVPTNQLERRLKEMKADKPSTEIVVKGDKRLKYKDVREVMRIANESGFSSVGLIALKREQGGH